MATFKKKFNSRPVQIPETFRKESILTAKLRAYDLDEEDLWKYRKGRLPENEMALWKKAMNED